MGIQDDLKRGFWLGLGYRLSGHLPEMIAAGVALTVLGCGGLLLLVLYVVGWIATALGFTPPPTPPTTP